MDNMTPSQIAALKRLSKGPCLCEQIAGRASGNVSVNGRTALVSRALATRGNLQPKGQPWQITEAGRGAFEPRLSCRGLIIRYLFCTVIMVVLALTVQISIAAPMVDGPIARQKFRRDVQELLYRQKFDELESLAKRIRETKARFPEGHWQLMYLYEALYEPARGPIVHKPPTWKWDRHFALLEKWQKLYPRSVTARVATANAWLHYGWEARGGGFSSAVTEEGWRILSERKARAIAQLQEVPTSQKEDCPERFNTLLILGKVEGWPRDKYMALFKAAVAFEPRYFSFYSTMGEYLTSRWSGDGNEWLEFMEKADAIAGDPEGHEIYARMVPAWFGEEWKDFDDPRISWSKMKAGHREMEKRYPDSPYNLNNFARLACMAGDLEVARELFKKIGNTPYLKSWQAPFRVYDECRKAAGIGGPLRAELKRSQEDIQADALAEQGDKYSQYRMAIELAPVWPARGPAAEKGMALMKASADQGYAPAQAGLGTRYLITAKDKSTRKLALDLIEQAALQDDDIKFQLPRIYQEGLEPNLVKEYAWYACNDNEEARSGMEKLSKVLSPEQTAEAKKEAERIRGLIQWMPQP